MGNSYEVKGSIKQIDDLKTFASGFTKREFVLTTDEDYPQNLKIELIKDKCDMLDKYKVGDRVSVKLNVRGSEYNGRYFVNLQAWAIAHYGDAPAVTGGAPADAGAADDDNMPF